MKKKISIGFAELVWYPAVSGLISAVISQVVLMAPFLQ